MKACDCGGVLEFVYHDKWKCRDCGRWHSEDHAPVSTAPVPFLSREVVKPKPHASGREGRRG